MFISMGFRTCMAGVAAVYLLNGKSNSEKVKSYKRYSAIKTRKCNLELLQSLPGLKKTRIVFFQSQKSLRFMYMNHWRAPTCLSPKVVLSSVALALITRTYWMSLWKDTRFRLKNQSLTYQSHSQFSKRQIKALKATDKDLPNFVLLLNKIDPNDLCMTPRRPQALKLLWWWQKKWSLL